MGAKEDFRHLNAYWVVKGRLLAGSYPGNPAQPATVQQEVISLAHNGITHFYDLTEVDEAAGSPYPAVLRDVAHYTGTRLTYQRLSIPDMGVPPLVEMRKILNIIDQALESGGKAYLHCYGGRGRTGTVVGCYLVRHGANGAAALDTINRLRRGLPNARYDSPETFEQRTYVLNWGLIDRP